MLCCTVVVIAILFLGLSKMTLKGHLFQPKNDSNLP